MRASRPLRRVARATIERALLRVAAHKWSLAVLNMIYRRLGTGAHAWLQGRFAKLFRSGQHRLAKSTWTLPFAGRTIALPMHPDRAWLDWDAAFSTLGHEPAIKSTYRTVLTARARPDLFVDIGGNYGTHSLLFLVAGVDTLTFEPNSSCHEYFREVCALNGVKPRLEHAALGAAPAVLQLQYPERETWLGSIDPDVVAELERSGGLRSERVTVRTLDDFEQHFRGRQSLVKIDAEGHEAAILAGGERILRDHRPVVIFEVHGPLRRARVREILDRHHYSIAGLPILPDAAITPMDDASYAGASVDDFLAIPAERFASSGVLRPDDLFSGSLSRS